MKCGQTNALKSQDPAAFPSTPCTRWFCWLIPHLWLVQLPLVGIRSYSLFTNTWHINGHHSCRVIWVLRELCKAGVLWAQKDGEGVKWDDTSTNIMPVTAWWKGHNDGSQHLILHFKAVKPCATRGDVSGNIFCNQANEQVKLISVGDESENRKQTSQQPCHLV